MKNAMQAISGFMIFGFIARFTPRFHDYPGFRLMTSKGNLDGTLQGAAFQPEAGQNRLTVLESHELCLQTVSL